MNGITYFRLNSSYDGDVTKNCALTGSEVDNNFYTLEGRDIKSVELQDGKIVVNLMNGTKLTTDNITDGLVRDLSIDFDETNGILTITQNGVQQTITGFATNYTIGDAVSVDDSINGNGLPTSPIGVKPTYKTGQYRPVDKIVDATNGEKLPKCCELTVGERFLLIDNVNEYGYLYNYKGLKKIACKLKESGSQWRIPTKEDWDDMLNAIEPRDEFRNHSDARSNKYLGKFAGKFLKTVNFWKKEEPCENECNCDDNCGDNCHNNCGNNENTDNCYDHCIHNDNEINWCEHSEEECACGRDVICSPSYCGEYGTCHHKHCFNNEGIDKYGFSVLPAGYTNEAKDYMYFTERAYFWTATNHDCRDAYIKVFAYNKSNVLQDVMASDNFMSVRLVKDYSGDNFNGREDILGSSYSTVLMPSLKHGRSIWTSINLSIGKNCGCDCDCETTFVLPNNGEGMEYTKKYFMYEWTGKNWTVKELLDGESVVVIDDNYSEYRLVNGELKNVADVIYERVVEEFHDEIDGIVNSIDNLNEKIDNEIERSTTKDEELEQQLNDLSGRLTTDEQNIEQNAQDIAVLNTHIEEINQNVTALQEALEEEKTTREQKDDELEELINELSQEIADETEQRQAEDERLQNEIDEINQEFDEFDGNVHIQEGSNFDYTTGTLTLKSKNGNNDILIQINPNFGTF